MKTILLHGLGQTSSSWKNTINTMGKSADILCPNLFDWFEDKEVCYQVLYLAFSEYCKQFSEPVNICGLSLGGILALQYGIENPDKINSLALVATQYTMPKKLLQFQNMLFRFMPKRTFESMGLGKTDFINLSKSMINLDFQKELKCINSPVMVICGEKDTANKQASLQLQSQLPQAELFNQSFNRFLIISLDVLICRYSPLFRAFPALFISEEPHKSFYYPSCFRSQK